MAPLQCRQLLGNREAPAAHRRVLQMVARGQRALRLCSFQGVQKGGRGDPWYLRSKHQIKEGSRCHTRISEMLDESRYIKNMLQAV